MKKHRTEEVIDFGYESTAVPVGCIEKVLCRNWLPNKQERITGPVSRHWVRDLIHLAHTREALA